MRGPVPGRSRQIRGQTQLIPESKRRFSPDASFEECPAQARRTCVRVQRAVGVARSRAANCTRSQASRLASLALSQLRRDAPLAWFQPRARSASEFSKVIPSFDRRLKLWERCNAAGIPLTPASVHGAGDATSTSWPLCSRWLLRKHAWLWMTSGPRKINVSGETRRGVRETFRRLFYAIQAAAKRHQAATEKCRTTPISRPLMLHDRIAATRRFPRPPCARPAGLRRALRSSRRTPTHPPPLPDR